MKLLSIFLLVTSISFAQKIEYAYSPSGNRTLRKFNTSAFRVGSKDSTQSAAEFSKLVMQEGISVYPNPTTGKVTLSINNFDPSEKNSMTLTDTKGSEILSQKVNQPITELDISTVGVGIYYIKVVKNENTLYYKLVKM